MAPLVYSYQKLPLMPFPDDERVLVVAEYMQYNGVPMSAFKIESDKTPKEFLRFYTDLWSAEQDNGAPGYNIQKVKKTTIVSRVEGGAMFTVQANKTSLNGSSVTLGVSLLPSISNKPELGKGFPLMRRSRVINDILNVDEGKKARTLLIENSSSFRSVLSFYQRRLKDLGWSQFRPSKESSYYKEAGNAYSLQFSKGQQEIQMSFTRSHGKTMTVALVQGVQ